MTMRVFKTKLVCKPEVSSVITDENITGASFRNKRNKVKLMHWQWRF